MKLSILLIIMSALIALLVITDTPEAHKPKAQNTKEHRTHGMLQHVCKRGNYKYCDKIKMY